MKKKFLSILIALFVLLSVFVPAFLASATPDYVIDDADLLTYGEEIELEARLEEIIERQSFDIVVVTVDDLEGKSAMEYADDYYDYNGYGQGAENDGCLLLIHMDENRGYWISTTGFGIEALTDYGISCIGDDIVPYLSSGEYYDAFLTFAEDVDSYVTQANEGTPFDIDTDPSYDGNYDYDGYYDDEYYGGNSSVHSFEIKHVVYGLIAGLIVALIVVSILSSQLKSVRYKPSARDYFVDGSLNITGARDVFVGVHVTKTARSDDSSHSGGSSTHTGSSGTSHGGGGGSF